MIKKIDLYEYLDEFEEDKIKVFIYNLKNNEIHNIIYNHKNESSIIVEDEIINKPWTYAYEIHVNRNGEYIKSSEIIPFAEIGKIKNLFTNSFGKETDIESVLSEDIVDLPDIHKNNFMYIMIAFIDKFIFCNTKRNIPKDIQLFIDRVLEKFNYTQCYIVNICFYLKYLIKVRQLLSENNIFSGWYEFLERKSQYEHIFTTIKEIISDCELYAEKLPFSTNLTLGRIYDLIGERILAEEKYKNALRLDKDNNIKYMLYDQTIYTYTGEIKETYRYDDNIVMFKNKDSKKDLTIVISTDEEYFKYYGATLILLSNTLHEIHFHFHIIGQYKEVKKIIKDAKKVHKDMCNLMEQQNSNPSFSTQIIPPYVKDKRTFYACSRYINADFFMHLFDTDIFIMDADISCTKIPYEYFQQCKNYDVVLTIRYELMKPPGRKILAGGAFFKNNENSKKFIELTRDYMIYNFINSENLWVLDQNALEYTLQYIVQNNLHISVTSGYKTVPKTPFLQNPYKSVLKI